MKVQSVQQLNSPAKSRTNYLNSRFKQLPRQNTRGTKFNYRQYFIEVANIQRNRFS